MHEKNIELLRDEAQRLLSLEVKTLNEMLQEKGVVTEQKQGEMQTFDRSNTPKYIEVLEGEKHKLERLEMVLAIVGTMKAGKSTTINAIVGTEVLPNRNRPMTALPTLIEHTPGQLEPKLEFNNNLPIDRLMVSLREAISLSKNSGVVTELHADPDMHDLLELIESNGKYKKIYHGAESIFWFLKGLNDLVRLSKEFCIDFPFSDYDEIHELPVIKIEFAHLRETDQASGRLTLLDTPGPNESGQPHLRKMLKEQLTKASAVLAVLDFTQLKSDADAQVREDLRDIAEVSDGRLYALVNKFDNKDRNSDTAEEVKAFVANTLMERSISEDTVFPVSSKLGYLANRARSELFVNKRLPNHEEHPWVADFGREAFGPRWERKLSDIEAVREHAEFLWEDSLFHAPLERVIRTAQTSAAVFAIDSASAKLLDIAGKLDNFLNARETSLTKSIHELRDEIGALQRDISRVGACEVAARTKAEETLRLLEEGTKAVFDKTKSELAGKLNHYFKEGKSIEQADFNKQLVIAKQKEKKQKSGIQGIISAFLQSAEMNSSFSVSNDFDPSNPKIKFSDKAAARKLLAKITNSVNDGITGAERFMKEAMNQALAEFQIEFSDQVVADVRSIIDELESRMKKSGFAINLNVPDSTALTLDTSGSAMLGDLISEKTKTISKQRRQSGAWGTVCSWFGTDDWGWEDYSAEEQYFEINIEKIHKAVMGNIDKVFGGLEKSISEKIRLPLNSGIKEFFDGFKETVEQIRGDLLEGIRGKESSKAEQDELARGLASLKKSVKAIRTDCRELQIDVKQLLEIKIKSTT